MPAAWQKRYLKRFYDRSSGWVDGTTEFHQLCAAVLPRGGRILEIGPGGSNPTSRFLATLGEVHGLDPDPAVRGNDALRTVTVLAGDAFPWEAESFDGCVSNYVIEHLADPGAHLREVRRVLRPGAAYAFRTPNRFHYVALASALAPHWVHVRLANPLRNLPPDASQPHPTTYRMNSRRAVRRQAAEAALAVDELRLVEKEPSYGLSSRILFLAFTAYERLVNATEVAADLRSNIFAVLRKPKGG
jgi:SAM-dependent methyltransferase